MARVTKVTSKRDPYYPVLLDGEMIGDFKKHIDNKSVHMTEEERKKLDILINSGGSNHIHGNFDLLEKITEDANGNPLYDGKPFAGSGTGAQGPKGDKGDPGPQGPKGDKGDKGDPGGDSLVLTVDKISLNSGGVELSSIPITTTAEIEFILKSLK